jgi:hypothetical protein
MWCLPSPARLYVGASFFVISRKTDPKVLAILSDTSFFSNDIPSHKKVGPSLIGRAISAALKKRTALLRPRPPPPSPRAPQAQKAERTSRLPRAHKAKPLNHKTLRMSASWPAPPAIVWRPVFCHLAKEVLMLLRRYVLAGVLALSAGVAAAAPFSYDYVEGGFGEADTGDALFVGGSSALDKNLYVLGNIYALDFDRDVSGAYLEGGLGYHVPLSAQADFFVNGQLLYANFNHVGNDDDDLGAIARAGVRFLPVPKLELEGSLALSSNDFLVNDGIGISASARYFFQPALSAAIGVSSNTELDGLYANVRYNFK